MSVKELYRTSKIGKKQGGEGIKYFVDCASISNDNTNKCNKIKRSIKNKQILYYKKNPESAIIESIIKEYINKKSKKNKTRKISSQSSHPKKTNHKPIIIKTWHYGNPYGEIYRDFNIAKQLQDIPGFIKFIAFLNCHDNSYKHKTHEEINKEILDTKKPKKEIITIKLDNENICEGGQEKQMLIMPYYSMSSVKQYNWNDTNYNQFIGLLIQVIYSCYFAFIKYGFIHADLHLDNVLIEPTTDEYISHKLNEVEDASPKSRGYLAEELRSNSETKFIEKNKDGDEELIKIKTNGMKAIIMDFERSYTDMYPKPTKKSNLDVTTMLRLSAMDTNSKEYKDIMTFQEIYEKIIKQADLWEDFIKMFSDTQSPNLDLETPIGNFTRDKFKLFSNYNREQLLKENYNEEQLYEKTIQSLYNMKKNNITDGIQELYKKNKTALYSEITKLSNLLYNIV